MKNITATYDDNDVRLNIVGALGRAYDFNPQAYVQPIIDYLDKKGITLNGRPVFIGPVSDIQDLMFSVGVHEKNIDGLEERAYSLGTAHHLTGNRIYLGAISPVEGTNYITRA